MWYALDINFSVTQIHPFLKGNNENVYILEANLENLVA